MPLAVREKTILKVCVLIKAQEVDGFIAGDIKVNSPSEFLSPGTANAIYPLEHFCR